MKILPLFIILFLLGSSNASGQAAEDSDQTGQEQQTKNQSSPEKPAPEKTKDIEQEKKELKLMLVTGIVVLSFFFLGILLITFLRIGRRYRKRVQLGKPDGPTEYVDTWSQYRLEEDEDEKTTGEEKNKS